ncbi:MAG: DUF481 domain-containing protein [Verrucomicrobiae bacterium]|nr:DUF481 domain-containing protein [Verrucomicrobiae bacterium]NNJ42918.1 DUF481 domain-containing protein [Akkermansiaceae bacterium]
MNASIFFATRCIPLLATATLATAQTHPAEPTHSWKSTGAAGISLAQGNADTLSYNLNLLSVYELDHTEAKIGADWHYAENQDVQSTDSFRAFGEFRHLLNDRFYLGSQTSYLVDAIAEIDYRIDLGVVAGYYFIKNNHKKLSLEAGPGYAWQKQAGIQNDDVTLRLALHYEHQLAQRSKLWFSSIYTPTIDDFSDSLVTVEAGIDTDINDHWAIRTSVRHQYVSSPAAGRQPSDTLLSVGLRYALGGYPDADTPERSIPKAFGARPEAIQKGWTSTAALTLALAQGNADSLNTHASYDASLRRDTGEFFFSGKFSYAEANSARSADSLITHAQLNHFLAKNSYLGMSVGFLRDNIAEIDYRITPAVTLGHYMIKNDRITLSFEAGPGLTIEKAGGIQDSGFAIVAGERLVWEINERISLKQSLTGHINPSETDNYTLVADVHLDTDITEHLAWRLAASWVYDNTPAVNKGKDDITLSSGIAFKF